jgi:hypothetical protein
MAAAAFAAPVKLHTKERNAFNLMVLKRADPAVHEVSTAYCIGISCVTNGSRFGFFFSM